MMDSVIIRADASVHIGTGHVMRCITLAERLRARGARVGFVCNEYDGHLCEIISNRGFSVQRLILAADASGDRHIQFGLEGDAWRDDAFQTIKAIEASGVTPDWLIVDHYGLDVRWERALSDFVKHIMVVDDLGNRPHMCSILLDQNLHDDSPALYRGLVGPNTRCFFGPRYSLLRSEFDAPGLERPRDGTLSRLLVFFGGTDVGNQSTRVLDAIRLLGDTAPSATVVLGPTNPGRSSVWRASRDLRNVTVIDSTDQMAQLIAASDLAVGTCGFAAWERCALGLPAIVTITADNQRDDARILHERGACINLGDWDAVSPSKWAEAIGGLENQPAKLARMAVASRELMRGRGEASAELMGALRLG